MYFQVLSYVSNEPVHEISNNVVCATSKASDQPAYMRSLIRAFASRLNICFAFLSLIGDCRGSSESTLVEMSNCWKSHATALIWFIFLSSVQTVNICKQQYTLRLVPNASPTLVNS